MVCSIREHAAVWCLVWCFCMVYSGPIIQQYGILAWHYSKLKTIRISFQILYMLTCHIALIAGMFRHQLTANEYIRPFEASGVRSISNAINKIHKKWWWVATSRASSSKARLANRRQKRADACNIIYDVRCAHCPQRGTPNHEQTHENHAHHYTCTGISPNLDRCVDPSQRDGIFHLRFPMWLPLGSQYIRADIGQSSSTSSVPVTSKFL